MDSSHSVISRWKVPDGYQQVSSFVNNITVFAPVKKNKEDIKETKSYNCYHCGASTKFNVSTEAVTCEHCGCTVPIKAEKKGKEAEGFEFTVETLNKVQEGLGISCRELTCNNCGAEITFSEKDISHTCPFCTSNKVNIRKNQSDQLRPEYIIPFKIKSEETRNKTKEWLKKGWFHPKELSSFSFIESFTGIYLPFWTFNADITATWEAEVGYEKEETYYCEESEKWKTETKIEWQWKRGVIGLNIDNLIISGTSHISRTILEKLYPFDFNELIEYSPDFLAGWKARSYDTDLLKAWEEGKKIMREKAKSSSYIDTGSKHVRNFSMTADFENERWKYVLLPVYISSYKFGNNIYQVMVNGQTGAVGGQKPVAWWKVWFAIALMLIPGVLNLFIGLPLLLIGGSGAFFIGIGMLLLFIGAVISIFLYNKVSKEEEI